MCIFETPPCIYYLSDKNLEDEEYLKLFTLFGAIFDAPPDAIGKFTSFLKSQEGLSPRAYKSDEIVQMRKKIIRPHAKRVNPYGCYDITRYGTFFNVNVPKSICQGCPYSVSYKNARREKENMVIAAILQNGAVPDRIRMQMELSGSKAAENIMHSIFMIQGKGAHRGKFDMIGLNAFLLFNLCSNNSLSAFESMENMTGYIKNRFKNDLLKNIETVNSQEYIYEMLCRELERISCTDVGGNDGKNRLEKAVNEITLTYQYDRGGTIRNVMDRMGDVQPETDNVPFVIEAVDVQPLVSGKVSIMDDSPVKDRKLQAANLYENVSKREKKAGQRSSHKPDITEKKELADPEKYYPENYRVDSIQEWKQASNVNDNQGFPFIGEVDGSYIMAVEKFSFSEGEGLIVCAGDGKFYIYRLNRQSDNKAVRELVRRRPLMVTMNSVELHALLKKYRLYEYRTADLKDMFTALNTRCALPCTYRALMENISGMDLGGGDFYLSAMEHYGQVYMSCLKKMTDNNVELFELYSCVSSAIGCSWDAVDIFRDISVLYKRKGLFEYQSECPENIIPDTDGSLYFYCTDDVPAKNEMFYLGLVRELVRLEAVKLGKVLVLRISDRGLVLFAFETDGTTYELLQWPCVYLARKLNIKDSHVHYHRQVYVMQCGTVREKGTNEANMEDRNENRK